MRACRAGRPGVTEPLAAKPIATADRNKRAKKDAAQTRSVAAAIDAHVQQHPDATLAELCAWLLAKFGVSASIGTMWNTPRQLELTLKKVLRSCRAGARRYRRSAAMAGAAAQAKRASFGVSGRNPGSSPGQALDQDQYGAAV
jgi:hypothetical protein